MSYDVSEQAADDTPGWSAPTGPRHRYDPSRAGAPTGGYPAPPPSIAAQLRPSPGWNGGTTGQGPALQPPAAPPSWTSPGAATSEWLSPARSAAPPHPGPSTIPPVPGVPSSAVPPSPVPPSAVPPSAVPPSAVPPYAAPPSGPAVPPQRSGGPMPEWVQTPSGEWVRAKAAGDWAATASGEWQPVTRRRPAEPDTAFGATPSHGAPPPAGAVPPAGPPPSYGAGPSGYEPPAQTPPPASPYADPVYRTHDPAAADVRGQVVRRVRFMNFRHAEHAWERRYRDPIGPHALAFLYAEPARGKPPRHALKTATRLFLAGPEVDDLPQLLADLTGVVAASPHGQLDCRTLADRAEEMSPGALYMGIAVSSLDTPAGRWADVRQQVAGSIDVPGRCFALLSDGTMILMDRGGQSRFGHFEVRSTDSLDEVPGDSLQRWTYDRSLADLADPATYDVWVRLRGLHDAIVDGGHR